ncbi:MAG: 1-acyl-sn-glycerol-3-phosphate acyltransferase [Cyanobacteria bacterium SZAS TMP-1]|nr:1-acyl-sn-glycerol-3-phosphate acyltransferase [Cyanobacteria bacterium SZAS TMP-1]
MSQFLSNYRDFLRQSGKSDKYHGFDLRVLARVEPFLSFIYHDWWRVEFNGLEKLPSEGAGLIVGNSGSFLPWPALMLLYALMSSRTNPRRIHFVADLDWIKDERLYAFLVELGFVPFSSANMKRLFAKGELVAIFPEGISGLTRNFANRCRLIEFDWVKLLPAVEEGVTIFPLATLGCDEATPILTNLESLAKLVGLPAFPITPFFPWLPFPFNLASLPTKWQMSLLKPLTYDVAVERDKIEETVMKQAQFAEGEIQAELNRLLRQQWRHQG